MELCPLGPSRKEPLGGEAGEGTTLGSAVLPPMGPSGCPDSPPGTSVLLGLEFRGKLLHQEGQGQGSGTAVGQPQAPACPVPTVQGWTDAMAVPDREPSPPVTREEMSLGLFATTLWGGRGAWLCLCLSHFTDYEFLSSDSDARERQEYMWSHTRVTCTRGGVPSLFRGFMTCEQFGDSIRPAPDTALCTYQLRTGAGKVALPAFSS